MTKRILVIEDEPQMLLGLRDNLELEGYEVITAADGEEGLAKAVSTAPDLVKFQQALFRHKLLDKAHTELVTTGKVEGPRGMGRYGYGFGDNNIGGKHSVGHNGGFPGIAADLQMFPETGYTAVALMNTDPPALMPVAKAIRERIPAK